MLNRITVLIAIASYLLVLGGIVLAHFGVIRPSPGAALFALGGLVGLVAVGCATAILFTTQHWPAAMAGMLGSLPFLALLMGAVDAMRYPRINDIATDLEQPPAFVHAQTLPENADRDLAFPPENAALIREHYSDVIPLTLALTPDTAYAKALAAARDTGWEITRESAEARTFEAVAETALFRWRDDIVVRVTPLEREQSRIDVRSKSREGKSDLGANARRIRRYLEAVAK